MKILFVTNMYPTRDHPASGTFVMHQAEQLKRLGHEVDIFHILGYRSKFNYLKAMFQIFVRTLIKNYDIAHAHYGLSGFSALFRWRTPLVITLHGSDALVGKIQPFISKFACRFADAVIAVSKKIASVIPGEVIPCGVDLSVFKPYGRSSAREKLGLPMNKHLILFPFDPLKRMKRYDLAKEVIEELCVSGHDVELLVVSNVKNEEMPFYYSAADAMILCSDSEGSPTSVKEALACNVPVVSTNVGDIEEIMDGIPGTRICDQNIRNLASCLEEILNKKSNDFEARPYMQRYSQVRLVKSIIKVYEKIFREKDQRSGLTVM